MGGRDGEGERRKERGGERGNRKALHLKERKNVSKHKMETKWLAFSIAGKDVEPAVDQKLSAVLPWKRQVTHWEQLMEETTNLEEEIHYL